MFASTDTRLRRYGVGGILILLAIMPFHAFLSVWLGSLTHHQSAIQAWKDVLSLIVVILAGITLMRDHDISVWLRQPLTLLVLGFTMIAAIVTLCVHPNLTAVAYGVKTDLEPLALLLAAIVVGTSRTYGARVVIVTGLIAAIIALVLSLLLPPNFLTHFGYGPTTIAPYQYVDPALHAFRTPGTLGGPNQLGAYLVIPLCLLMSQIARRFRWRTLLAIAIIVSGIVVTYSRSALVAAVIGVIIAVFTGWPKRRALVATGIMTAIFITAGISLVALDHSSRLEYYILHTTTTTPAALDSTNQHFLAVDHGIGLVISKPFGGGLGSAGPASFQTHHAIISEDYYLQIALETGIIGLIAFIGIIAILAQKLWQRRAADISRGLLGALIGLSVANLFLHVWADSTTALVFFGLTGLTLGVPTDNGVTHGA